jgi:DNA-binding CsgD family transcriptional regulator
VVTHSGASRDLFVGRAGELSRVDDIVKRVHEGEPWLVVIEGESGIGKSTLARRVAARAEPCALLMARADRAEADLEYGVAQQLLQRVDPSLLAGRALLAGGPAPGASPFAVGADLLAVIGALLARGPVVMAVDDVQWADRPSVQALTFVLRRLSVEPLLAVMVVRGDREGLDEATTRLLASVDRQLNLRLGGLGVEDIVPLAQAMGLGPVSADTAQHLYAHTGGHALYLCTLLSEQSAVEDTRSGRVHVTPSLAAAVGDQLAQLSSNTRAVLEMLAVADRALPLARLGEAAGVASPAAAIEPALAAGLADWQPDVPSSPVRLRHALQRDAIYALLGPSKRRRLHARAVSVVDVTAAWAHRVAALDGPDDDLAEQLTETAAAEAAAGHVRLAGTHLLWAGDISSSRDGYEERLLTAATYLLMVDEVRAISLRAAVEACRPSPLRSCVLGSMATEMGRLAEAEVLLLEAAEAIGADADSLPLAALIANRLAGLYCLLGRGDDAMAAGRRALQTGALDRAAASQTRTFIAIGASMAQGARAALAELDHLDPDADRIGPVDVDALSFRGVFHLVAGQLDLAVRDLEVSVRLVREGASFTLGLRAYLFLALAQYLSGTWDEVLLTAEQALSEAVVRSRRYELPFLHLAAVCVPAGRGAAEEAEQHAALAEAAAADLPHGQERVYAGMARALTCQAAGNYPGMAAALEPWHDNPALDGRVRGLGVLWRPLLVEGLLGSGRTADAAVAFEQLAAQSEEVVFLRPALAWLKGWLAEARGSTASAREVYERAAPSAAADCPLYAARLSLAYGRLLRRMGERAPALEQLSQANDFFARVGATPFLRQVEQELAECGEQGPAPDRPGGLHMTSREAEVARLVALGLTDAEVAAKLFVTPKAISYHLSNIYAKHHLSGRRQLRQLLTEVGGG